MGYKEGDIVKVKSNLEPNVEYGSQTFVHEMDKYKGKMVTIEKTDAEYRIKEDNGSWHWTGEMFEDIGKEDVGNVIYINPDIAGYDEKSYLKGKCDAYEEILNQICNFNRKD